MWKDCNTCNPATMAFVVAIAGMMFPAIPLALYKLCNGSIENTCWRRLDAAATNLMAMSSSLSNSGSGGVGSGGEALAATSTKHDAISATQSPGLHTSVGAYPSLVVGGRVFESVQLAMSSDEMGTGTLSAVLYRSIPICFRISVANSAVRASRALERRAPSSPDGGSSDVDSTPRRERSSFTTSMYVLFSPPGPLPPSAGFSFPPSSPSSSTPPSPPSSFSFSAASMSALRLSSSSKSMLSSTFGPKHSL
mmetsp:Transcript_23603/g.50508  ORF Transcript_23603/g.50508 Transcript_23603/m.50508 type:complete len:251 (-) Transcript_23603:818-1570(-)